MKSRRLVMKIALGAVVPAAILLAWHLASGGSAVVPSIGSVVNVLIHPFRDPPDLDATPLAAGALASVLRVACGFLLAALTAIPIGLLVLADYALTTRVPCMF